MNATAPAPRRINWPSVSTIVSATILIGAEVFGAAYAAGWALATLLGVGEMGEVILEVIFAIVGIYVMYLFVRSAQAAEPFTARS